MMLGERRHEHAIDFLAVLAKQRERLAAGSDLERQVELALLRRVVRPEQDRLSGGELRELVRDPHIRLIAALVLTTVVVKQLIDYQFNTLTEEAFVTRDAISAFQGKFNAATQWLPVVVLDRPNPIGGLVQGNILDPAFRSFVGPLAMPIRHGMTLGEAARLANRELGLGADLRVVPVSGWRRDQAFTLTGLPFLPPSPNLQSLESLFHYPGTCLFEGTALSVGRGTDAAFRQVGATWLDVPQRKVVERYGNISCLTEANEAHDGRIRPVFE